MSKDPSSNHRSLQERANASQTKEPTKADVLQYSLARFTWVSAYMCRTLRRALQLMGA
jgi:hypothetical protein